VISKGLLFESSQQFAIPFTAVDTLCMKQDVISDPIVDVSAGYIFSSNKDHERKAIALT